jgi:hypothetical protein
MLSYARRSGGGLQTEDVLDLRERTAGPDQRKRSVGKRQQMLSHERRSVGGLQAEAMLDL